MKLPQGLLLALALAVARLAAAPPLPPSPDEIYGTLFADVQRAKIFPDQKTFPDCVPRGDPTRIVAEYAKGELTRSPGALRDFVAAHFLVPETAVTAVPATTSMTAHLAQLWDVLHRAPDRAVPGSSLLPLPHAYVIPGGRFREVYYWDSYFTMLGLRESGREDVIESMVENFAHLVRTYGLIPNGNRTYYLSRSQPPFFALMVELIAEKHGAETYREYLPALRAEYAYWMDETPGTQHVVRLPGGGILNRYFDRRQTPRPEAWALDEATARSARGRPADLYRDLRSAAESGWDFSSRWFGDGRQLTTIETTNVVPVDLNALLWQLERTLAHAYAASGDAARAQELQAAADRRREALLRLCWSEPDRWFCDFRLRENARSPVLSLAGVAPLFVGLATPAQAGSAAETIRGRFLKPGGVVTTLTRTGQQWDAPNGWAPLQWMTIRGLENYEQHELAREIAGRWVKLNRAVYAKTGKMLEKYDVEDLGRAGGGGEYPNQDGFGWTNGVFLKLVSLFPEGAVPPSSDGVRPGGG